MTDKEESNNVLLHIFSEEKIDLGRHADGHVYY